MKPFRKRSFKRDATFSKARWSGIPTRKRSSPIRTDDPDYILGLARDRLGLAEDGERIALTKDFSGLALKNDLVSLIRDRRSARIYTNETMTPDELSFLLWATQGIKKIRGKAYATIHRAVRRCAPRV